ncbi:MAG: hypothetical protein KY476_26435, partial [Planctomycetes bacterium]|nr:hypothetical protein [Planctomycetota bacterium]
MSLPAGAEDASRAAPRSPAASIHISVETTFVTEPLSEDGCVEFAAALNRQLSRGVTPENNAAVLFYEALGPLPDSVEQPEEFFRLLGMPRPLDEGEYFTDLRSYLEDVAQIAPGDVRWQQIQSSESRAASRPWMTADYPHIARWLALNEKPLALIIKGTERPRYYSPVVPRAGRGRRAALVGVLLPGVQVCRGVARALAARAMLRLGEDHLDAAWEDLRGAHRLARHIGSGAFLIEGLVGVAIEAYLSEADAAFLQFAHPAPEQIVGYLRDLQAMPPPPDMSAKVNLGERLS